MPQRQEFQSFERENDVDTGSPGLQSGTQSGKLGVLRVYVLMIAAEVALVAFLRRVHASWGTVSVFLILIFIVVLFGKQLTGPTEHAQISLPAFERRIQNRYRSESNQLSNLGFAPLFFYGEAFPLFRLLLIYPAILLTIMWLNREVVTVQNRSRLLFGFLVFNSSDRTIYAQPMQLGIKFFTRFRDGTILMTKSFGGKKKYGPTVVVHAMSNANIRDTWTEHQKQVQALEATGKQVDCEIGFEAFSNISRVT
jgi:hypothetical protein